MANSGIEPTDRRDLLITGLTAKDFRRIAREALLAGAEVYVWPGGDL